MVLTATLYSYRSNIHVLLLVAVRFTNFVQGQHCKPKDCLDLQCYRVSKGKDGPHTVYPGTVKLSKVQVSCDQTAQSGGWTVYMRRHDGTVNFTSRTWAEYKNGFGQHGGDTELWLGNEIVHQMTIDYRRQDYALRVEVRAFNGTSCGLNASQFFIKSEVRKYSIRFNRWKGEEHCISPSRNLLLVDNDQFQTYDHNSNKKCLSKYHGGWWYSRRNPTCTEVYLTGKYYSKPTVSDTSMHMKGLTGTLSLTSCAMLFRRNKAPPCNNPCLNNGICEYLEATKRSHCVCPETHCGERCQLTNTCKNGGSCMSVKDTVLCLCASHFTGARCEIDGVDTSTPFKETEAAPTCHHPCLNNGICEYLEATKRSRCACPETHCGERCELKNTCKNGGTCTDKSTKNTVRCLCASHFTGAQCEIETVETNTLSGNEKAPICHHPCLNNGICKNLEATKGSRCVCPVTHCGDGCEKKNTCMNGGTCTHTSTMNKIGCLCSRLFTGAQCEVETGDTSAGNATATAKTVWTTPVIAAAGVCIASIIAIGVIVAKVIVSATAAATPKTG